MQFFRRLQRKDRKTLLYKKYIILGVLLALCGCGFEPLYVEKKHNNMWYYGGDFDTSITSEMSQVSIQPISERFGQVTRNELMDLLTPKGAPKQPKYRLFVNLSNKTVSDQALRSDITATRKMVKYKVRYYMTEGTERVLEGDSIAYVSYDILANPYSTTMAQKKGDEDAAKIIANDIALRLGAYFHSMITNRGNPHDF